jgi:hypothetical protein
MRQNVLNPYTHFTYTDWEQFTKGCVLLRPVYDTYGLLQVIYELFTKTHSVDNHKTIFDMSKNCLPSHGSIRVSASRAVTSILRMHTYTLRFRKRNPCNWRHHQEIVNLCYCILELNSSTVYLLSSGGILMMISGHLLYCFMLFYFLFYTDGDLRAFTLLFYIVLFLVLYWWWSQDIVLRSPSI